MSKRLLPYTQGEWVFKGECIPLAITNPDRASAFQVWCGNRVIAEVVSDEEPSIGVTEGIANSVLIANAARLFECLLDVLGEIDGDSHYPDSAARKASKLIDTMNRKAAR